MNENKLRVLGVTIVKTKSERVKARADVRFERFKVKGFKILHNDEKGYDYVTAPSYQAGSYWRPLFTTEDESDWKKICRRILEEYDDWLIKETGDEIQEN